MGLISSVFIATSLDGYIARENGDLDWLDVANKMVPAGEDCGYESFMSSVDVLVMGRLSYEKVLSFGEWPYKDKRVIVLSRQPIKFPTNLHNLVEYSSNSPEELCGRLSKNGVNRIYIDGGITIQRFLIAGLIDEITITVIPVVLGAGKSLFGSLEKEILLKHIATTSYEFGFVQTTYEVKKSV